MIIDFEKLSELERYKSMSNTIFPRPIAWISTEDEGVINLAPFSYFAPLSSKPALVIVSIAHKEDGEPKDTFANIMKHKKCTINLAHKELLEDLKNSAEELPKEQSECEAFGIEMKRVLEEYPPMVSHAKCALFCELFKSVDIGNSYEPLILEIKGLYIDDGAIGERGHIKLENIGRVGMEFFTDATRSC